jgi:hypothetical protein
MTGASARWTGRGRSRGLASGERSGPVLWVFAFGPDDHVRVAVTACAVAGGWGYRQAGRGWHAYLVPCGDAKHAADQIDGLLKHRMYPATW